MNPYNTLYVGRLPYTLTEKKLIRSFDNFGSVNDVRLITKQQQEQEQREQEQSSSQAKPPSLGYAFIEFTSEEGMKAAYANADGMDLEGRYIVVDVMRLGTVKGWLPRRLGGGIGCSRADGKGRGYRGRGRVDKRECEGRGLSVNGKRL